MHTFLTQTNGDLPANPNGVPSYETEQFASVGVDRTTRSLLTKVVNLDASKGGAYVTNTDQYVGNIKAITAHEAAVVNVTSASMAGDLSAVPIPAGMTWFVDAQSVTPVSGKVTIYAK